MANDHEQLSDVSPNRLAKWGMLGYARRMSTMPIHVSSGHR